MVIKKTSVRTFKIIVIGDSGVGKTCLTYRFCCNKFPPKTEVTIGVDFREKSLLIDTENIKLQFWDTAGQERFRKSMIQHYYRGVDAIVFVYDVTNISSFEALPSWISECERFNLTDLIPRILIGNKVDTDLQRVPTQTAQKFADAHNMPVFETSALDESHANHVESIFMTLAHKLKASKPMMGPSPTQLEQVPPRSIVLHRGDVTTISVDDPSTSHTQQQQEEEQGGACFC